MEKTRKKCISILLLCCMVAGMAANGRHVLTEKELSKTEASAEHEPFQDWVQLSIGEYPITPVSPEWEEMDYCEALDACNMPQAYAQSLSTEDLAKYALNYPFLMEILAFDSIKDGIDSLSRKSSVFQELFSRPDHIDAFIKEYQDLPCNPAPSEESDNAQYDNDCKKMFLEAYLGVNYKDLSAEQANAAFQEHDQRRLEFPEASSDLFYGGIAVSLDFSPEDAPPENMGVAYTTNEDGTYTCDGTVYQHKLLLQGVSPGTAAKGSILILTNHTELTYYDVWHDISGSSRDVTDLTEYVILGMDGI